MIVKILTFARKHGRNPNTIGSSIIRGQWLVNHWPEASLWTEGCFSDALIFQKVYWPEMIELYPGVKILDLCDPDWLNGTLELVKMSKMVDAITCSSAGLYEYIRKIVGDYCEVRHIPDRLDLDFFDKKKEHFDKAKAAVWFGYSHNARQVLPQVLPSLANLNLNLVVVSDEPFAPSVDYGVDVSFRKFMWETIKYDLQAGDILINPQPMDNVNYRYKSENKTWIAWAMGLPVANNEEEMKRFLDPDERKKEADEKIIFVRKNCDINQSVKEFQDLILTCQKKEKS